MIEDIYKTTMEGQIRPANDDEAFDHHVLACILSAAKVEVVTGVAKPCEATGLSGQELFTLVNSFFPDSAFVLFNDLDAAIEPELEMEEEILRDLLLQYADPDMPLSRYFARMIAARSMRDDHLWQDLGLLNRNELGRLLSRHFPRLAAGNTANMKWKKYFYRKLCEAEGFTLCTAPSCRECGDFDNCFGEETGESRMARLKNGMDAASA